MKMKRSRNASLIGCCSIIVALISPTMPAVAVPPPPITRIDTQVDTLFGVPVADPYRWLEDQNSPETRAWLNRKRS